MNLEKTLYTCQFASTMGDILLVVNEIGAVRRLSFHSEGRDAQAEVQDAVRPGETVSWGEPDNGPCAPAARTIGDFLRGEADGKELFALPLDMTGTPFQQKVWAELCRIPTGQTITYGELSRRVTGDTKASRAVGRANATNPVALIVPCHRVIGANGALTGYAYGTDRKSALLDLERGLDGEGGRVGEKTAPTLDL